MACETTLPGSGIRREDAFEHDAMVAAIRPCVQASGHDWQVLDWAAPMADFTGIDLVMLGSSWNYQDREGEFLSRLEALDDAGVTVCNSLDIVRWNMRKTYLQTLGEAGAATIPTLWLELADARDANLAFDALHAETIVVKRQIGAGAEGQFIFNRGDVPVDWSMDRPAMIQPFLPAIQDEGEYSFIFTDGEFSHALIKRAAAGDYRIQSLYGGTEQAIEPAAGDLACAAGIIDKLPFDPPLYARIDMVRGLNKELWLMEAEMIEPYLYPLEGPELGPRLAAAINRRLRDE